LFIDFSIQNKDFGLNSKLIFRINKQLPGPVALTPVGLTLAVNQEAKKRTMRSILDENELAEALTRLNGWSVDGKCIKRRWKFESFAESLAFINRVGALAEAADHHPDITFGWGYAEILLTTHDRGGITEVDVALAAKIDLV